MKNNWKWILGASLVVLAVLALPFLFRNFGFYGMMNGFSGWRHPMMGGYGFLPFGGFLMGLGMLLMWIIPLGLLFLVVYGAVRLASGPGTSVPAQACPNCGKAAQADWKNCPHCGIEL